MNRTSNSPSPTPSQQIVPTQTTQPSASPGQAIDADTALGTLSGSKYTNDFFGFSITFPKDWYIASRDDLIAINNLSADLINKESGNKIDLSAQQILPLFLSSTKDPLKEPGSNPSINANAENLSAAAGTIKAPKDYINLFQQTVKSQGFDMTFGEVQSITVDGVEFAKIDTVLNMSGVKVTQTVFAAIKNGYALNCIMTYYSDNDKKTLEDIFNTLDFK